MKTFVLNKIESITPVGAYLKQWDYSKPCLVTIQQYKKDRSVIQNKLINKLYTVLGKESGNGYAFERGSYKWNTGCPILANDNAEFAALYFRLMDMYEYEEVIELMGTGIVAVSSIMNTKQCSEYIDAIYKSADERGIYLEKPDDLYYEALGIKR